MKPVSKIIAEVWTAKAVGADMVGVWHNEREVVVVATTSDYRAERRLRLDADHFFDRVHDAFLSMKRELEQVARHNPRTFPAVDAATYYGL